MSNMKEIIVLAQEINTRFMEREQYDCPDFEELLAAASVLYEVESTRDLRFIAYAIELCGVEWNNWTTEWQYEMREAKSQAKWENANRGEL